MPRGNILRRLFGSRSGADVDSEELRLQRESVDLGRRQVVLAGKQIRLAVAGLVAAVVAGVAAIVPLLPERTPDPLIEVLRPPVRAMVLPDGLPHGSPPPGSASPENRCPDWKGWFDDNAAALSDQGEFTLRSSAPTESGATVTELGVTVLRVTPAPNAVLVTCAFDQPPPDATGRPFDLTGARAGTEIDSSTAETSIRLPASMAAGTTSSVPFRLAGRPGYVYEWTAHVRYRVGSEDRETDIGSASDPIRTYSGNIGRLTDYTFDAGAGRWVDADTLIAKTGYVYLTDQGLGQLWFGSSRDDVLTYVRSILGPADDQITSPVADCPDARELQVYRWKSLSVSFLSVGGSPRSRLAAFDYNVSNMDTDVRAVEPKAIEYLGQIRIGDPLTTIRPDSSSTMVEPSGTQSAPPVLVHGYAPLDGSPGNFTGTEVYTDSRGMVTGLASHVPAKPGFCDLDSWGPQIVH